VFVLFYSFFVLFLFVSLIEKNICYNII